jgi:chromosomal replication initiation ATPase DnaA
MTIDACASPRLQAVNPKAPPVSAADITLIEQLVMRAFGIDLPTLISDRRGRAPVAFARQVAIYLSHVHLRMSLTVAARLFRRDRTTAGHACRRVEDRRDDPEVDRRIEAVATALEGLIALGRDGGVSGREVER